MRKYALFLAATAFVTTTALTPGWASPPPPPPSATFGVYDSMSNGGVAPTHNGADTFDKYTFTIPSGGALNDSIAIKVCLDASSLGGSTSWSDQVVTDINGAFNTSVSISPASSWQFDSSQTPVYCQNATINIAVPANTLTGNPGVGFTTVIQFKTHNGFPDSSSGQQKLKDSFDTIDKIHIFVQLVPSSNLSCYITDSDGNFLLESDGVTPANASGDMSGTFDIIANAKGRAVATNPGQFYYNLLWKNTGTQTIVGVSLTPGNLVYNGNQAIHWLTFPTAGFAGVTTPNFDAVNEGNPAGHTSPISSITVPAGSTLYVTEHLEWTGIGQPAPTGPVTISIQGTVTPPGLSCTAGATGSLKQ